MGRSIPILRQGLSPFLAFVVVALFAGLLMPGRGFAQTENADPVAAVSDIFVVDFQGIVRRSAAANSIQDQVASIQRTYQTRYNDLEIRLRELERELAELRGTITEEEFVERRRSFELEITQRQREAQTQRTRLDQASNQAMGLVRSTALQIIAEMAESSGTGLVLNKSDVILSDRELDKTEEVLSELDRRLPTVEVDTGLPIGDETERSDD